MEVLEAIKKCILEYCIETFGIPDSKATLHISPTNPNFRDTGDYSFNFNNLRKFTDLDNHYFGEKIIKESKLHDTIARFDQGSFLVSASALKTGFINIKFSDSFWIRQLQTIAENSNFTYFPKCQQKVLIEYCGPNTNKPLHIGHIRNMLLGYSVSEIFKACGYEVIKVNIYNDRGIAICKSMAAYIERGKGETPQSTGIKGDHFVGDYYVLFGKIVEEQLRHIYSIPEEVKDIYSYIGKNKEVAEQETPIFQFARELLLKWEAG
ncbi:MAG: arginine--tRNA ligase, partial [Chitinophagales bacterium]|nr:arginine--tRNA ligase [Chitinophagales bacterium]